MLNSPKIRYFLLRLVIGLGLSTFFFWQAYQHFTNTRTRLRSCVFNTAEVLFVKDNENYNEEKDDHLYVVTFTYWDKQNKSRSFQIKTSDLYSQGQKYRVFYPPKQYKRVRLLGYWSLFSSTATHLMIALEILLLYVITEHYMVFRPQK
ncbi:hypothetical protein BKI52_27680 [marine bacterium AO1-C]|nr:hypothetical protein BKI52_27680 [marine bacterium AO1-C]